MRRIVPKRARATPGRAYQQLHPTLDGRSLECSISSGSLVDDAPIDLAQRVSGKVVEGRRKKKQEQTNTSTLCVE